MLTLFDPAFVAGLTPSAPPPSGQSPYDLGAYFWADNSGMLDGSGNQQVTNNGVIARWRDKNDSGKYFEKLTTLQPALNTRAGLASAGFTSDYMSMSGSSTILTANTAWTLSMWFSASTGASNAFKSYFGEGINGAESTGGMLGLTLGANGTKKLLVKLRANDGTLRLNSVATTTDVFITTATWVHVVITYDGTTGNMTVYIDGVADATNFNSAANAGSTPATQQVIACNPVNLSAGTPSAAYYRNLSMFASELSPTDVADLYAYGNV